MVEKLSNSHDGRIMLGAEAKQASNECKQEATSDSSSTD